VPPWGGGSGATGMRADEINARIARRLALRREAIGLSLQELAQRCDMSAEDLAAYEAGDVAVPAAVLQMLAAELHTSAGYFHDGGPAPFRPSLDLQLVRS
jgi:transcriptional regulator with XRE-family HTH domain